MKLEVNKRKKTRKCKHVDLKHTLKKKKNESKTKLKWKIVNILRQTNMEVQCNKMNSRSSSKREVQREKHLHLKNILNRQYNITLQGTRKLCQHLAKRRG